MLLREKITLRIGYNSAWKNRNFGKLCSTRPSDRRLRGEMWMALVIIELDGEWSVAYCPKIPGANGRGRSKDEAKGSLADAISLILEDRREEGLRGVPPDAIRETVTVQ